VTYHGEVGCGRPVSDGVGTGEAGAGGRIGAVDGVQVHLGQVRAQAAERCNGFPNRGYRRDGWIEVAVPGASVGVEERGVEGE